MRAEYVHHEAAALSPDGWRKLWVVEWQDVGGRRCEREHRSRAAADAHLGHLGLDLSVTTASLDGLQQW